MFELGSVDLLFMAVGSLGISELDGLDAESVSHAAMANFVGPAAAIASFVGQLRSQGCGRIVVLSSVAGVRVRKANLVYGAAKAGLDGFALGLADALEGSGVGVTVVRPGFVRTKMTSGLKAAPFASPAQRWPRRSSEVSRPVPAWFGSRRCSGPSSRASRAARAFWRRLPPEKPVASGEHQGTIRPRRSQTWLRSAGGPEPVGGQRADIVMKSRAHHASK